MSAAAVIGHGSLVRCPLALVRVGFDDDVRHGYFLEREIRLVMVGDELARGSDPSLSRAPARLPATGSPNA